MLGRFAQSKKKERERERKIEIILTSARHQKGLWDDKKNCKYITTRRAQVQKGNSR